jgi:quinoprotein glucose dehydrogenase
MNRLAWATVVAAVGTVLVAVGQRPKAGEAGWPEYGGTLAGQRYSAAQEINRGSVQRLKKAWSVDVRQVEGNKPRGSFEATPVLWNGTLYLTTPKDVVLAVDAATGKVRWSFDPKVEDVKLHYIVTSRGVALWHDTRRKSAACADRVFAATLDRRLIALDARTGSLCSDFGRRGEADLARGLYVSNAGLLEYTSPPVVVGDRVILGSSVADNQNVDTPSGAVRAFDARTGAQLWKWEPVRWVDGKPAHSSGAGNAWAPLAADAEHDLVFVPTGSASVDYYGGTRVGDNRDADSIVALRASTGEKVWAFQLVHHNLWDYDTASQPLLFMWRGTTPAVAVMNKTGMVYVFNRLTGEPLFPIEERPVPAKSDVAGEVVWPTQPFSAVDPLLPMRFSVDRLPTKDAEDERFCRELVGEVRYEGPFTPPSMEGAIIYPAALGGPNWGSSAFDPKTGVMYTRVNSMPYLVWLHRHLSSRAEAIARYYWEKYAPLALGGKPGMEELKAKTLRPPDLARGATDWSVLVGTPYQMYLRALVGPNGAPCGGAPYGRVVATNLNTGKQMWSVTHGEMREGVPGSTGMSGPLVTVGGLVFVAGTEDPYLRAYDAATGRDLWKGELPGSGTGTPMTYVVKGRQYVVVATGSDKGDTLVAFSIN